MITCSVSGTSIPLAAISVQIKYCVFPCYYIWDDTDMRERLDEIWDMRYEVRWEKQSNINIYNHDGCNKLNLTVYLAYYMVNVNIYRF